MSEWKPEPGEWAMLSWRTLGNGVEALGFQTDHDEWQTTFGAIDSEKVTARPLVVIDPEDAEQVRALANAWDDLADKHAELTDEPMTLSALRMQAALREFARPTPSIEEPMGRFAVVADAAGYEWCRTGWDGGFSKPWEHEGTHVHWSRINPARVLSPGVEATS